MKIVYEAPTVLDAHMILNLLQQEEIEGRVEGGYLQGGAGELQAINLVRVEVPDEHVEAARKIIHDWEEIQPEEEVEKKAPRNSSGFLKFLSGLLLGIFLSYWIYK